MSAERTKKSLTWEERETKRLRNLVYDQLAYYIQVQLPEGKYVNRSSVDSNDGDKQESRKTSRASSKSPKKRTNHTPGRNEKYKGVIAPKSPTKKESNGSKRSAETGEALRNSKSATERRRRQEPGKRKPRESSSSSSSESDNEDKKAIIPSRGKRRSKQESRTGTPQHRKHKSKSLAKQDLLLRKLDKSPYAVDLTEKNVGNRKPAENMRKEAERVAATTTKLLNTLPLSEVVMIQKYRSEAKKKLRCSSSLSQHSQGMLNSGKALKYAKKHDGREAARKYQNQQAKKEEVVSKKEFDQRKKAKARYGNTTQRFARSTLPLMKVEDAESATSDTDSSQSTTSGASSGASVYTSSSQSSRTVTGAPTDSKIQETLHHSTSSDDSSTVDDEVSEAEKLQRDLDDLSLKSDVAFVGDATKEKSSSSDSSDNEIDSSIVSVDDTDISPPNEETTPLTSQAPNNGNGHQDDNAESRATSESESESSSSKSEAGKSHPAETSQITTSGSSSYFESNGHGRPNDSLNEKTTKKEYPPVKNGGIGLLSSGDISELHIGDGGANHDPDVDVEAKLAWEEGGADTLVPDVPDNADVKTGSGAPESDTRPNDNDSIHDEGLPNKAASVCQSVSSAHSSDSEDDLSSMTSSVRRIIEESHLSISTVASSSSSSSDESSNSD